MKMAKQARIDTPIPTISPRTLRREKNTKWVIKFLTQQKCKKK